MSRFFLNVAPRRATCPRGAIGCVAVLALLLLAGTVGCQMPANNSAALDEVANRLKKVTDEMASKRDLAATEDTLAKAHNDLGGRVSQLDTRVGQLAARVDQDIQARLDKLDTGLRETNQRLAAGENSAAIGNHVVDWRLHKLEEPGHAPTFQGVGYGPGDAPRLPSPSPSAQPSDTTSRTWGVIEIQNNMADWEYMEVNGTATGIAPHTTSHIIVPAGKATTRLIGFEGTKTWWVGSPDYVQRVVIAPKPSFDSVVRYP
ncbi:MAG: hypothetical protein ACLP9L_05275 [Thermoguttaceae bacterium]